MGAWPSGRRTEDDGVVGSTRARPILARAGRAEARGGPPRPARRPSRAVRVGRRILRYFAPARNPWPAGGGRARRSRARDRARVRRREDDRRRLRSHPPRLRAGLRRGWHEPLAPRDRSAHPRPLARRRSQRGGGRQGRGPRAAELLAPRGRPPRGEGPDARARRGGARGAAYGPFRNRCYGSDPAGSGAGMIVRVRGGGRCEGIRALSSTVAERRPALTPGFPRDACAPPSRSEAPRDRIRRGKIPAVMKPPVQPSRPKVQPTGGRRSACAADARHREASRIAAMTPRERALLALELGARYVALSASRR